MQALRRLGSRLENLGQRIYDQHTWILLFLILAVGLLLREWGISFGLPFEYHVDERPYLSPAWLLEKKQFDFVSPFSLIVLAEHKLLQLFTPLLNLLSFPPYFDLSGATSQTVFFVLGRLTSALLGTATAIPVYLIGKGLWSKKVGLVAALFLALSFLHVRNSHYGVPDVAGTFFVAMTAYFCTLLSPDSRLRYYVLAGTFAGLAISDRLTTLLLFVPIVLYHAFPVGTEARAGFTVLGQGSPQSPGKLFRQYISRTWRWFWADVLTWRLVLVFAVAGLAFLVSKPQLIMSPLDYARGVYHQLRLGRFGGFGRHQVDSALGWIFYLKTLRWGIGDLLLVLSIGGIIMPFIHRSRQVVFLFSFPLLYYAYMGKTGHVFARYAMPLLPFLALAAAGFLCFALSRLRVPRRYAVLLTVGAIVVIVAQPVYSSLRHDLLLTRKDTRTIAKEWIEEHIPEGSSIALEWHTPPLATATNPVPMSTRTYRIMGTSVYGLSELGEHSLEYYEQQGVEYLISSSFISDIHMVIPEEDLAKRAFYESLDEEAELMAEFRPYSGEAKPLFVFAHLYGPATLLSQFERPGPVIKMYRLGR
jgi:hypothetical protein